MRLEVRDVFVIGMKIVLTAEVIVPRIGSGILPAFFRMRSREPPSMYSMHILISPSL